MTAATAVDNTAVQKQHYDAMMEAYEAHYDDPWSRRYRRAFMYEPMMKGVELKGARVLEAMCGSGTVVGYLLDRGAKVTGLDISSTGVDRFRRRWPGCEGVEASVFETGLPDESFDHVVVFGGFHHVTDQLDRAVVEMHRVLRRGGSLCFGEPHAGALPDLFRRLWYRVDGLFEEGERAVDIEAMERRHADKFEFVTKRHLGSVAYLGVYNSMVFRFPLSLKRYYSPPMMLAERLLSPLMCKPLSCFAVCRWVKK